MAADGNRSTALERLHGDANAPPMRRDRTVCRRADLRQMRMDSLMSGRSFATSPAARWFHVGRYGEWLNSLIVAYLSIKIKSTLSVISHLNLTFE
jgi:hypothetical protein